MTGRVVVDLRTEPDLLSSQDRKALDVLRQTPDGAQVTVDIGRRSYVSTDAARLLREHGDRLKIEIVGADPAAVQRFISAGRSGDWQDAL